MTPLLASRSLIVTLAPFTVKTFTKHGVKNHKEKADTNLDFFPLYVLSIINICP